MEKSRHLYTSAASRNYAPHVISVHGSFAIVHLTIDNSIDKKNREWKNGKLIIDKQKKKKKVSFSFRNI